VVDAFCQLGHQSAALAHREMFPKALEILDGLSNRLSIGSAGLDLRERLLQIVASAQVASLLLCERCKRVETFDFASIVARSDWSTKRGVSSCRTGRHLAVCQSW
jgi:hypothetical protein